MKKHSPQYPYSPPPPPSRARIKSLIETNFASGVKPTNIGSPECIIIVIQKSFQRFRALRQTHVRVRDSISSGKSDTHPGHFLINKLKNKALSAFVRCHRARKRPRNIAFSTQSFFFFQESSGLYYELRQSYFSFLDGRFSSKW